MYYMVIFHIGTTPKNLVFRLRNSQTLQNINQFLNIIYLHDIRTVSVIFQKKISAML